LARVGLADRGHHYPTQLSGGEQQRVALARAFSNRPRLLFADEPTGNLDAATGAKVIDLMAELNRELGTTLVLVTHDHDLASRARRIIRLADGRMVGDSAA
jgi:putative ABC transport system ATP-binding protein